MALVGGVLVAVDNSASAQSDQDDMRSGARDLGDVTHLGELGPVGDGQWSDSVNGVEDEVDYYKFSLSETKLVGIGLRRMRRDADLFIENSSGDTLSWSRDVANTSEWLNASLSAGSYFVRVEAQESGRNNYKLVMGTAGVDSAAAGPGTSAVVPVDGELQEEIRPYWDIDWLRMELVADHVYVLEVRGRGSGVGTLMDPELYGVYTDPTDAAVFQAYRETDRAKHYGKVCSIGLSKDDAASFLTQLDRSGQSPSLEAHDLDDGEGNDAWMLYRAEATGSHYMVVTSAGGFSGTYTAVVAQVGALAPHSGTRGWCGQQQDSEGTPEPVTPAGLVVSRTSLNVAEGGTDTFTVRLATQPTADVVVTVASDDPTSLTLPPGALTFTTLNWTTAQTVTVTAAQDADADDEVVIVTASASSSDSAYSGKTAQVTVNITDDESAGLVVDPASLPVNEGATNTFTVKLATQPSADVSVTVESNDTSSVTVPSSTFTFTTMNWNTAQTVTVTGVEDDDAVNETPTVTATASSSDSAYSGETAEVSVTVTDNDTAELVVNPSSLPVGEGGTNTFTVKLATQPSANVMVTLVSDDPGAATVPSDTLTFTTMNWSTVQSVTVTAVEDDDIDNETPKVTATASSTGSDYNGLIVEVTVNVIDDDIAELIVDPSSLPVNEGGTATFTVKLATQPSADVSVTVESNDTTSVTVPSSTFTFTTSTWSTAQTVTVTGVEDADSVGETGDRHGDGDLVRGFGLQQQDRPGQRHRHGQRHRRAHRGPVIVAGERGRHRHLHGEACDPAQR